ncbi:MAG: PAS domain S-box protein [bacterium]|nr:PAS domain S-box protein [bacterium]
MTHSGLKIFVTEDEAITALSIESALTNFGYTVTGTASSAKDTITALTHSKPDLLLLDIKLKGEVDGIEVADYVNTKLNIPVIFLTAHTDEDTLEKAKATQPYGYIPKPINIDILKTTIEIAYAKYTSDIKLLESEERFRRIVENTNAGYFYLEKNGKLRNVNQACCDIFQYSSPEEMIGHSMGKNILEDDIETAREIFGKVITEKKELTGEFRIKLRDGSTGYITYSVVPIFKEGEVIGQEGFIINVTEKKRAENERRKAFAELDQIFNTTLTGMCLIDKDYTIVRINEALVNMFDLEYNSTIGKKCHAIWDEPICGTDDCSLRQILSGQTSIIEYEISNSTAENKNITCKVTAVPFLSPDGTIEGILKNYMDITAIRSLEQEIMNISEIERQNIGQNLHDGLGQKLTGIAFLVEALRHTMSEHSYPELPDIEEIKSNVEESIEQTRRIAKGLCPVNLEDFGLIHALEELADDTRQLFGISCTIEQAGPFNIKDSSLATNLYYIARESVTNSLKHGNPQKISIRFINNTSGLTLSIEDNGKGSHGKKHDDTGMGLRIMNYRANMMGAEFEAKNSKTGFIVVVSLAGKEYNNL